MANTGARGQQRDKMFRDALRMELAAIGEDHKALRRLARRLIAIGESCKEHHTALAAIKEVADRMDGKPMQAVESHNINEYVFAEVPDTATDEEWKKTLADAAGKPSQAHKPI